MNKIFLKCMMTCVMTGMVSTAALAEGTENTAAQQAAKAYEQILSNAYSNPFADISAEDVTITYSYALVDMTGDEFPELLLSEDAESYTIGSRNFIKVYYYDPDSGNLLSPDDYLYAGVAAVGGFRGAVASSVNHDCLYSDSWYSGTGQAQTVRATLQFTDPIMLQQDTVEEYMFDEPTSTDSLKEEINFRQVEDLSALEEFAGMELTPVAGAQNQAQTAGSGAAPSASEAPAGGEGVLVIPAPDAARSDSSAGASTGGEGSVGTGGNGAEAGYIAPDNVNTFRGTILCTDREGIISRYGLYDYNHGAMNYQCVLLTFPEEISMTALDESGNPYTRTTPAIGLYYEGSIPEGFADQYDGKTVTVRVGTLCWPSDSSLPLGEPSPAYGSTVEILG